MKSGYLYIITNPSYVGWVKIGSTWDLKSRLHTYQTGDPFRRYKLEYSLYHPLFREAEKKIKDMIKPFALEVRGEWYHIDLEFAKSRLEEQLDAYQNGEF